MKKINIKTVKNIQSKKINSEVEKRYDKFNDWLSDFLIKYKIDTVKHEEFIKNTITLYMWDFDTDKKRKEIENILSNNPKIKKEIRKQKLKKLIK